MLKTLALAGAAALAFVSVAYGQQPMAHDMPMQQGPMQGGGMHGDMGMTRDFVTKAAASDKFEITEGRLAASMARNPDLRRFGSMMVKDHSQSTMKIKAAVRTSMGHNPPPPMLMADQRSMIADLRSTHGRDFDRTYIQQQLQAHQMALDLMTNYSTSGSDPALRRAAGEIVPVVQRHLDMLRDMQGRMH